MHAWCSTGTSALTYERWACLLLAFIRYAEWFYAADALRRYSGCIHSSPLLNVGFFSLGDSILDDWAIHPTVPINARRIADSLFCSVSRAADGAEIQLTVLTVRAVLLGRVIRRLLVRL